MCAASARVSSRCTADSCANTRRRARPEPGRKRRNPNGLSSTDPYDILITGVGGTGVVTIGALLGMAAHLEGKGVSVLDMTGLAQKFGAVTSHVRIAEQQALIHAMRIPAGEAHLLLGADLVVSAGDDALSKLHREHSYAVVNQYMSPTAEFTHNPDAEFPLVEMQQAISEESEPGKSYFVDATTIATNLLGDAIFANFFLLGVAYQQGLVPIGAAAIDEAIELNGVAIEKNRQAFLWGRRYVIDAAAVLQEAGVGAAGDTTNETESLAELIASRYEMLTDYQDQAYAEAYLRVVERVRKHEGELQPALQDAELPLTRAVAEAYFKLLAYKDEYEVARLYSNGDFLDSLAAQFEGDYQLRFHLAPPLLAKRDPVSGKPLKREFGGWMLGLMRVLARFKRLRGGRFDLFGYTEERRLERRLITQYQQDIDFILGELKVHNLESAIEMASLPLQMRGFGHVKLANIERCRQRHKILTSKMTGRDLAVELFTP